MTFTVLYVTHGNINPGHSEQLRIHGRNAEELEGKNRDGGGKESEKIIKMSSSHSQSIL